MYVYEESKFLESYLPIDTTFCDRFIRVWTERNKQEGVLRVNSIDTVDRDKKDSIDVVVDSDDPDLNEYFNLLQQCADHYITKYS